MLHSTNTDTVWGIMMELQLRIWVATTQRQEAMKWEPADSADWGKSVCAKPRDGSGGGIRL